METKKEQKRVRDNDNVNVKINKLEVAYKTIKLVDGQPVFSETMKALLLPRQKGNEENAIKKLHPQETILIDYDSIQLISKTYSMNKVRFIELCELEGSVK